MALNPAKDSNVALIFSALGPRGFSVFLNCYLFLREANKTTFASKGDYLNTLYREALVHSHRANMSAKNCCQKSA